MSDITITIIFLLLLSYLIFTGNTWLFFSILHFDELREKKDNKVPGVESEWKLEISGILWDNLKIFLNTSENLQPFFLLLNSDFGSFWSFEVAIFPLISYRSVFSSSHWRHWDSILSHTLLLQPVGVFWARRWVREYLYMWGGEHGTKLKLLWAFVTF